MYRADERRHPLVTRTSIISRGKSRPRGPITDSLLLLFMLRIFLSIMLHVAAFSLSLYMDMVKR